MDHFVWKVQYVLNFVGANAQRSLKNCDRLDFRNFPDHMMKLKRYFDNLSEAIKKIEVGLSSFKKVVL